MLRPKARGRIDDLRLHQAVVALLIGRGHDGIGRHLLPDAAQDHGDAARAAVGSFQIRIGIVLTLVRDVEDFAAHGCLLAWGKLILAYLPQNERKRDGAQPFTAPAVMPLTM